MRGRARLPGHAFSARPVVGRQLADCGRSLPPQDAAISDPQKPRLFEVSPKRTDLCPHSRARAMEGFFYGQLGAAAFLGGLLLAAADGHALVCVVIAVGKALFFVAGFVTGWS
jgi:hypothetical protein